MSQALVYQERGRWREAFGLAAAAHVGAIIALGLLPAARDGFLNLETITVFEAEAVESAQPVELVALPRVEAEADSSAAEIRITAAGPSTRSKNLSSPESKARPAMTAAAPPREKTAPAPFRVARAVPAPERGAGGEGSGARGQGSAPKLESVSPGGGGGGGPDLGARSAAGELTALPGGSTPRGEIPGTGSGSGGGEGGGSGGGRGGGQGVGTGTGSGEGSGGKAGSGGGGEGVGRGSGGGAGGGFTSRLADRQEPEVVWKGQLSYPQSAAEAGLEGTVRLRVLVMENGGVGEVTVTGSSGAAVLDRAAAAWVKKWRYRPAVQDGIARRVYTQARVKFELE
jgi:protein TonB